MLQRREFLKCSSLLPFAPALGRYVASSMQRGDGRILVVVELNGGNDGINTVVPFRDEGYEQHRKELRIARDELHAIDSELGLHPGLRGLATLLERGELALVQGVGYPTPSLSHEVSLATWHTGQLDRPGRRGPGWLGRMFDSDLERAGVERAGGAPRALLAGPHALPGALRARKSSVATVPSIDAYLEAGELGGDALFETPASSAMEEHIRRVLLDARAAAETLQSVIGEGRHRTTYPASKLGGDLELIAQLIRAGLETQVFYAIQQGYDTHYLQLEAHASRLTELGDALLVFLDDLRAAGQHERVLVLVFSEFGRRVPENASRGTDHGTAGPLFLVGPCVQPGVHGATPSLTDLVDGNLKSTVDFRSVYATVLHRWLRADAPAILGAPIEALPLLRG